MGLDEEDLHKVLIRKALHAVGVQWHIGGDYHPHPALKELRFDGIDLSVTNL